MAKLVWDGVGERKFEFGVDHGVLYPLSAEGTYTPGVAWNGLTSVSESPSGAESNPQYADNIKYLNIVSAETFGATIEAFTYPPEFAECDGSASVATGMTVYQQDRKVFGFSYRTKQGNDKDGQNAGYKIHLVYGCQAAPSSRDYSTVNESAEAMAMSWEVSTTPVDVPGYKPTAKVVIDSTKVNPTKLAALEKILYGDTDVEPRMPLPGELITLLTDAEG